jgi:hypothetical protein
MRGDDMNQGTITMTDADEEVYTFTLRPIAGEPGWCHAVYGDGSYVRVREGFRSWGL